MLQKATQYIKGVWTFEHDDRLLFKDFIFPFSTALKKLQKIYMRNFPEHNTLTIYTDDPVQKFTLLSHLMCQNAIFMILLILFLMINVLQIQQGVHKLMTSTVINHTREF